MIDQEEEQQEEQQEEEDKFQGSIVIGSSVEAGCMVRRSAIFDSRVSGNSTIYGMHSSLDESDVDACMCQIRVTLWVWWGLWP
jgi:hypothetical protein